MKFFIGWPALRAAGMDLTEYWFAESIMNTDKSEFTLALTPTQWLPKPATSWFPQKSCALRATWSPGEREKLSLSIANSDYAVSGCRRGAKMFSLEQCST
jgi:hypothetical protein